MCALLTHGLPALDEESYLWIANEMSWARPYDWQLPWPPYDDAFIYAHPPLFLWWVKSLLVLEGESLLCLETCVGELPWQFVIGSAVGWLLQYRERRWALFAVLFCLRLLY